MQNKKRKSFTDSEIKRAIIAVNGFINSGKSTIQEYLCSKYGFVDLNFADLLKDIVSVVFGMPRELLEGDTNTSREWREKVDTYWTEKLKDSKFQEFIVKQKGVNRMVWTDESGCFVKLPYEITPRILLQYFADLLKEYLGDDYFCSAMENMLQKEKRNIVISDARFPGEYDLVKKYSGLFWRVLRKETHPKDISALHKSDTSLLDREADCTLENDFTINHLHALIDEQMKKLGINPVLHRKKLRIGVDIDGVLYNFHGALKRYLHEHHSIPLEQMSFEPDGWDFHDKWSLTKEEFQEYYKKGISDGYMLRKGEMLDQAAHYIKQLRKQGHSIHLVSNRKIVGVEYESLHNTLHWLKENKIKYDTLDFDFEKGGYVEKYKLDVFVDDSPKHYDQVQEAGCKTIFLFDQLWNRKEKYENYNRVSNWQQVVDEINKILSI